MKGVFLIFLTLINLSAEEPLIYGVLRGQLGNQMFHVAATCSLAWDHNATPCFPDLVKNSENGIPLNYQHVFFRCVPGSRRPQISRRWNQPHQYHFSYTPIPFRPNMEMKGVLQNERYFAHNRDRILNLFSPREDDLAYITNKYKEILAHPKTVGIQVRNFGVLNDRKNWWWAAQYGLDYFQKAMALFPEDSLFVVTTNDSGFARQNVPVDNKNIVFLENEPYYIELYLLSMLKHNIISNSTFGWWAAWLNQNRDKIVVTPRHWINPASLRGPMEVWPEGWIQIDAEWATPNSNPSFKYGADFDRLIPGFSQSHKSKS